MFTPASNNWLLDGKINRLFPAFTFSPESLWRLYLPSVKDSFPTVDDIVFSSGTVKANMESATFSKYWVASDRKRKGRKGSLFQACHRYLIYKTIHLYYRELGATPEYIGYSV